MKDPQIRQLLLQTELKRHSAEVDTKIVHEMRLPVAKARIDVAVINGYLHGYEIKSASDTLQRLPAQIEAYTKVFDYLTIVTEDKYLTKLLSILPHWVGINVCNDSGEMFVIQQPQFNNFKEGFYIAKLLWRAELIDILEEQAIDFYKGLKTWTLCEILAKHLDPETISTLARLKLKQRKDWKLTQ